LEEGTFPRKWKQQRLVLLPKGKKPPDQPSSYRPLCMIDTAAKILERIIHRRIEAVVDPLLADNQYGFRKGRSTLDAISLVVNTARNAIAGTRWKGGAKKYCLVATSDIRNAFNSANWDCIMHALQEKDIGSRDYDITGAPQGSVLGPLLWNIMYDGLLRLTLPRSIKLVAYADDVAVVIVAKHLEEINSRKALETIKLKVGEQEITSQPYIRYLGVMLDARLNFKQQG
ncbi:GSCOCG00011830001-RA-CDS, partial [Cotesia congregata]